jgi:hypothetical protein
MLDAPGSFIYGMDTRFFDLFEPPSNVLCIDLDTNADPWFDEQTVLNKYNTKIFPKKALNILRNKLNCLYEEINQIVTAKKMLLLKNIESKSSCSNENDVALKKKEACFCFTFSVNTSSACKATELCPHDLNQNFDFYRFRIIGESFHF